MIEQVCMLCETVYGHKPGNGISGQSHRVCPACAPGALEAMAAFVGGVSVPLSDRGREVACA